MANPRRCNNPKQFGLVMFHVTPTTIPIAAPVRDIETSKYQDATLRGSGSDDRDCPAIGRLLGRQIGLGPTHLDGTEATAAATNGPEGGGRGRRLSCRGGRNWGLNGNFRPSGSMSDRRRLGTCACSIRSPITDPIYRRFETACSRSQNPHHACGCRFCMRRSVARRNASMQPFTAA